MSDIRNSSLAPEGEKKIAWAWRNMPVLNSIAQDFERTQPFAGLKITLSVHLEAKTACLCRVMAKGGAEMHITGSNPLSTQDDIAAALSAGGLDVHAYHAATEEEYVRHLCEVLEAEPDIIMTMRGFG